MKFETSYLELGYQRKAVVPVEVARHLELKHKDRLVWEILNGKVSIQKKGGNNGNGLR